MSIDLYCADEQSDIDVDLEKWSELCRAALHSEGAVSYTHLTLPTILRV